MNEKQAMSGFLTLRVSDREGRLVYEQPCKNRIVTSGRRLVAQMFGGVTSGTPPSKVSHMAVGENFIVLPLTLPSLELPGPARQPSGGLGAAVKGLRPDPLRGLTAAPPPLPSQVGPGVEGQSAR